MYKVVKSRALQLYPYRYLKVGEEFIVTKRKKPVMKVRVEECREWPVKAPPLTKGK